MVSPFLFRAASIATGFTTAAAGSGPDAPARPARSRSAGRRVRVLRAGIGALCGPLLLGLLLAAPEAPSAAAQTLPPEQAGPDAADLQQHLDCAKRAARQLLEADEAAACGRTFLRIKLSFLPCVDLDAYDRLSPREKAGVNRLGYLRYIAWWSENRVRIEALAEGPPSAPVVPGE